jgi:outer membrane immunogenic protein
MKAHRVAPFAATAFVLCAGIEPSYAQTWNGPYVAGTIGSGMQPDGDNRIVRFDKTLDGDFSDTITTAAGANAFSPGFCNGAAVSPTPGTGCTQDDRAALRGLPVRRSSPWSGRGSVAATFASASSPTK